MDVKELFDYKLKMIPLENGFFNQYDLDPSAMPNHPLVPKLKIGEVSLVINHRIILIGTRFGAFVIYQRNDDPNAPVSYACTSQMDHAVGFSENYLSFSDFNRVFHPLENIGIWLENVYSNLKLSEA